MQATSHARCGQISGSLVKTSMMRERDSIQVCHVWVDNKNGDYQPSWDRIWLFD